MQHKPRPLNLELEARGHMSQEPVERYPLQWPAGWPRTKNPQEARFRNHTIHRSTLDVLEEVRRLGGRYAIISSNVPVRKDGLPRSDREPVDAGVAVWFLLAEKQRVIPCDAWDRVADNLHAIAKSIEAMRGISRWGAKAILDRALEAFDALPEPEQWWNVLGLAPEASSDEIRARRVKLARQFHPDSGTEPNGRAMADINAATERALLQRGMT